MKTNSPGALAPNLQSAQAPAVEGCVRGGGWRRTLLYSVLFAIFGVGLHAAAPTLNGLKLSGLPLGYWTSAQLGPLLLAALLIALSNRKAAS
jgi:putative solute:sodium symporter small subunit